MSRISPTASEFAASDYDPTVEKGFFSRVLLANRTFKTTDAHRMDDLNLASLPYIQAMTARPLEIKDVGSSSGISTEEWYRTLLAAGIEARMIGTDISTDALHLPGTFIDLLLDKDLNVIHLSLIGQATHPRILKALRLCGLSAFVRLYILAGAKLLPFRLVSKAVKNVAILDDDIESPETKHGQLFHVIRAANILNLAYFAPDRLRRIVSNLLRCLRAGGLFIVCRTREDGSNHATMFRYEESRLTVLMRIGEGSELEGILS
jgi:hypothetical protein